MQESMSTLEMIRAARGASIELFKARFKQKWFRNIPVFCWSELQLENNFKAVIFEQRPAVWLLQLSANELFDEKIWQQSDIQWFLKFGENDQHEWSEQRFEEQITELNERLLAEGENHDVFLIYSGGSDAFAKKWITQFENKLIV
jgi:hypothetical protein